MKPWSYLTKMTTASFQNEQKHLSLSLNSQQMIWIEIWKITNLSTSANLITVNPIPDSSPSYAFIMNSHKKSILAQWIDWFECDICQKRASPKDFFLTLFNSNFLIFQTLAPLAITFTISKRVLKAGRGTAGSKNPSGFQMQPRDTSISRYLFQTD